MNALANNRKAGDLRRHCAHYDVIVKAKQIMLKILLDLYITKCKWRSPYWPVINYACRNICAGV